MNSDDQRLLWEELNKLYVQDADNSMFVLSTGRYLLYSDYSPTFSPQLAAQNTFDLVDSCIACNVNYTLTGSKISTQWEQLLYNGKGPPAGAELQPAFENAKASLYVNYEARERSELYKNHAKASADFAAKKTSLRTECQQQHGDDWKTTYEEMLFNTEEHQWFEALDREVSPLLQAIDEWVYGPLATVMAPMKKRFKDNERSVVLPDGERKTYHYVSMIPANWYQWLDPNQPDDDSWTNITVNKHSSDNDNLSEQPDGKLPTSDFSGGEELHKKMVDVEDSHDTKINLKVRSVQINRDWLDLSALNIHDWRVPGVEQGAWSTGIIDSSNKGSFPLLPTQMIVAKDITFTGTKFNQELDHTDHNPSTDNATMGDTKCNSDAVMRGTQVIGYVCTVLPKYPAAET